MGLTCSKAYDWEDDIDENSNNNNCNNSQTFVLTESNPRRIKGFFMRGRCHKKSSSSHESHSPYYHHHHHHHLRNANSIARLDPALFALQERSLALYHYYNNCQHQQQQPSTTTTTTSPSSGEGTHCGQEIVKTAKFTSSLPSSSSSPSANQGLGALDHVGQYHLLFKKQQQQQQQHRQQKKNKSAASASASASTLRRGGGGRPRNQQQQQQRTMSSRKQQQHQPVAQQQGQQDATESTEPTPTTQPQSQPQSQQQQLVERVNTTAPTDEVRSEPFVVVVPNDDDDDYTTRLVVRRHPVKQLEEGLSGTHIYAVRWPRHEPLSLLHNMNSSDPYAAKTVPQQEQSPLNQRILLSSSSSSSNNNSNPTATTKTTVKTTTTTTTAVEPTSPRKASAATTAATTSTATKATKSAGAALSNASSSSSSSSAAPTSPINVDLLFHPSTMAATPKRRVHDWVTISEEHNIYLADTGVTAAECDHLVQVTEHVCRGQYAAYTYAKQTLGCREFPILAQAVHETVHTTVNGILSTLGEPKYSNSTSSNDSNISSSNSSNKPKKLALDDREPHMVKYDVTKKERQKLDMHTDKSEWTFLVSLSNGCGYDYEGGGTYFECLDATIHIQRGHALIFPGKLRHCGQRISHGLRFLLVGFLVDKFSPPATTLTKKDNDKDGSKDGNDNDDGNNKDKDNGSFLNALHLTDAR